MECLTLKFPLPHDVGLQLHHESDPDCFSSSSDEDSEDQYCDHVDISKYHFCPDHKAGSMKKDCATCSAALSVISDPELVNRLLSVTDTKAVNLERYKVRCDDVEQTMFLSPSIVELAKETFNGGKFRDRKVWKDLVKKYLTISHSDHLKLTEDISTEDVFNTYRGDKICVSLVKTLELFFLSPRRILNSQIMKVNFWRRCLASTEKVWSRHSWLCSKLRLLPSLVTTIILFFIARFTVMLMQL